MYFTTYVFSEFIDPLFLSAISGKHSNLLYVSIKNSSIYEVIVTLMSEFQKRLSKLHFSEKYIRIGKSFWISSLARIFTELNRNEGQCCLLIIKKM